MSIDLELWRMRIGLLEAQRYSYLRRAARKAAARDCAGRSAEHRSGRRVSGNAGRRWLGIAVVALITALSLLMRTGDVEAKSRLLDLNQVAENHFIERYCLNTVRCQNWNEVARGWWVFQSSTERADGFSLLQTCLLVVRMLLIMSGDVEQNPGPLTTQACHLDINDLRVVKNELMDATTKWYDIGLELGLSPGILGEIERQESHLPTCLRKMLSHWLKTTSPFPTWEALATVLESRAVGESHLALRLREEYCKPPETKPTLDQDEGSQLKLLVPIRSFSEGANYAAGETSGEDIQFPHLDTAGLSCEEKETLKGRLIAESRDIMLKFQKLVNKIQKSLDERKVPIPTLASHLCSLGAFTSVMATKPLLEECLPEIRAASNTEDAFWILRDYFSFFNYHIIEHIIHELGTDDDQRQFYMYMEAFKEYSKRRCIEFPRALQLGCPNKKGHVKFCVKLDIHFKHYRIEELQAFRSWLSTTLHVSEGALHLCFIGEGCIQFIFQIPLFVKEAIFPLSPEQERALLEKGIVEVECCEHKFTKKYVNTREKVGIIKRKGYCVDYKLLGRCRFGEKCKFRHGAIAKTYTDYVPFPEEIPISLVLGRRACNLAPIKRIAECRLVQSERSTRELKVVTSDPYKLEMIIEKLHALFAQLYPMGPSWCYFHTDGISEVLGKVCLKFQEYEGRRPGQLFGWGNRGTKMYEVYLSEPYRSQHEEGTSLEGIVKLTVEATTTLHSTLDTLHGTRAEQQLSVDEAVKSTTPTARARIMIEYREHMTEKFHDALSWILENQSPHCIAKLEARFGKLLWFYLPDEVCTSSEPWELDRFAEFVFCDTEHSLLFNPNVKIQSVDTLREKLEITAKSKSVIETLDVKFNANKEKLDMRIKIEAGGKFKILAVRKNERKVVTFDILCLHRQHDVRLSLSQLEIMPPTDALYPLVEDVFRSITFLDPETLTLVPCTEDWTVYFLRRKRKMAYNLDQKYMVSVSHIQEYRTDWEKLAKGEVITVRLENFTKPHVEVEFHNVKWQVAFGKDVGFSPEESLLLHMDPPHVDPALLSSIAYPWNTETIGEDLEEVMKHLDTLNESLGKA